MAVAPVPISGLADRRPYSRETARHVKRLARLQNVEARPRQLVPQRLDRDHVVRLRLLALVEPFRFRAVAQREIGRLDEGPGEVLVAVLGVPFRLLLAVTGAHAIYAARVGGEVAGGPQHTDGENQKADSRRTPATSKTRSCGRSTTAGKYAQWYAVERHLADIAVANPSDHGTRRDLLAYCHAALLFARMDLLLMIVGQP